ncbi:helix-turn-helix domain-containing protein [Nocardioides stalactiti]|uniref:helix-turn-helix domain-containing protein n=1 Tax=Nocardioides stalactiti TaxID=2755356 RepID=UPI001600DF11|nr:helix-turn-helix transcriptional regulator [Nocardioides stalactiti]
MSQNEQRNGPVNRAAVAEVRALVAQRRMSITELAEASGIPRSTLHSKLGGRSGLTVAELVQLAIALDVPAADLFNAAAAGLDGEGHP